MVPTPITEDYYTILNVVQTAPLELIVRSYRRQALELHPDRNTRPDATAAFQLLGRAYETLKDESKRREYDLIYPSIIGDRPSPQTEQTARPSPASTARPEADSEAAQIAALEKSKRERGVRWRTRKVAFDSSIFEMHREIQRLEQEIKILDGIAAAEEATEAWKTSWRAWLLSPLYKKTKESEEEKALKDRGRQERRIEKDMKERRLRPKKANLEKEEILLRMAKEEVETADQEDDKKIKLIQERIRARETLERQEKERQYRQKVQEQAEKEAESRRRQQAQQQAEKEAEARRRQPAAAARQQEKEQTRGRSSCSHDGWWQRVQGRTVCPQCQSMWTYLLQCPGCELQVCPKCQGAIRRGRQRRPAQRIRTPNPDSYDW